MELEKKHRGQFTIAEQRILNKALCKYFTEWNAELDKVKQQFGHLVSYEEKEKQLKQIEDTILIKVEQNTYK